MTNYHICTDRTYRYKNRSYNKKITELSTDIKKKTIKINNYRDWCREATNWLARTTRSTGLFTTLIRNYILNTIIWYIRQMKPSRF